MEWRDFFLDMSIFNKLEWSNFYVKGYPVPIVNTSQSKTEKYVAALAERWIDYLGKKIRYQDADFDIIEVPNKTNDYIFKLKNWQKEVVVSWAEFEDLISFNNFCLRDGIIGTYQELRDKYQVYKAFNDGWSDKIGYTPERLRVIYELWMLNKNLSIFVLIMNNKDLLMEVDKHYFKI